MRSDPLFSISFVQATLRDWAGWGPTQQATSEPQVYRMVRLYMPRSHSDLTERFDVIVLANANREAVGPRYIEMLARGVRQSGIGLFMAGGWETFGGAFGRPPWGDTAVGALLPTEDVQDTWVQSQSGLLYGLFLVIDQWDNELISSIPWKREKAYFMNDFEHNLVKAKQGANMLAHVESATFKDHPAMVTWKLDNSGRVFAYTGDIYYFCRLRPFWTYYIDFGSNLMIYLDNRPVPQDIDLVHSLRTKMLEVSIRKTLLMSLLEFCDSFGANTGVITSKMDELDDMASGARSLYLQLQFQETLDTYSQIGELFGGLEQEAMKLKDRTLLWVYVIEWLAVTATCMVCGFLLWSMMVRRMLYREIRTTRLTADHAVAE